ncbi:MAG TPA: efflux RND transporter periplasmic adaptor subunit [Azospirillaceae bacterium]|nr:efflux RND transporter periplasmic adaptor subunit [Azospirillaceae bacterium]
MKRLALLLTLLPATAFAQADGPEVRAQVTAKRSAVLSSEIAGQVAELSVREGESFQEGQVLVRLDCGIHRARLARAQAQETAARKTWEVKAKLDKLNSIGALELETAASERAVAEAEVAMAREVVERCVISAPFAGRVASVDVKRFQSVEEGRNLMEVLDPTELEVEMLVPSRWLSWLKPGHAFEVLVEETGKPYPVKVVRLAARIDPVSQSVKVFAAVQGRFPELLPGMSGRAVMAPPA